MEVHKSCDLRELDHMFLHKLTHFEKRHLFIILKSSKLWRMKNTNSEMVVWMIPKLSENRNTIPLEEAHRICWQCGEDPETYCDQPQAFPEKHMGITYEKTWMEEMNRAGKVHTELVIILITFVKPTASRSSICKEVRERSRWKKHHLNPIPRLRNPGWLNSRF